MKYELLLLFCRDTLVTPLVHFGNVTIREATSSSPQFAITVMTYKVILLKVKINGYGLGKTSISGYQWLRLQIQEMREETHRIMQRGENGECNDRYVHTSTYIHENVCKYDTDKAQTNTIPPPVCRFPAHIC